MKALFLAFLLPLAFAGGGCASQGSWVPKLAEAMDSVTRAVDAPVPVTKAEAQKVLAEIQKGHALALQAMITYADQTPCGTTGARQPPFCASLKAVKAMRAQDYVFSRTMAGAQNDIETMGDNPTVRTTALTAVRLAFATYKDLVDTNTKGAQ